MIREVRLMMTMPVVVELVDNSATEEDLKKVFSYLEHIENKFSFFKDDSETSKINNGLIQESEYSEEMREVLRLADEAKARTDGYFDVKTPDGRLNPSGLVKGWAIYNAAEILRARGLKNFYVDIGGDIELRGKNKAGCPWLVGVKNPFNPMEVVKTLGLTNFGVATSGTYTRGNHIYDPKIGGVAVSDIVSLTVVARNVYEADILATAAFAMGRSGIMFLEEMPEVEGYLIDDRGIATMTSGFEKLCV